MGACRRNPDNRQVFTLEHQARGVEKGLIVINDEAANLHAVSLPRGVLACIAQIRSATTCCRRRPRPAGACGGHIVTRIRVIHEGMRRVALVSW